MSEREALLARAQRCEEFGLALATTVNLRMYDDYAAARIAEAANLFTVAAALRAHAKGGEG